MNIIQTNNISKSYGRNLALKELNININQGEIFTLLGPNGAGKSTTIKILTTLLKPTSGTAGINNHDILTDTKKVRRLISLLPQGSALDPFLTVYDNLHFYAKLARLDKSRWIPKAEEMLNTLELANRKNYPIAALSGGQFRRVQIVRILLSQTPIIFLDEPTLGIDIEGKFLIWDLIKKYRKDNDWTIILSTNDIAEAESLSDRIGFLLNGSIKMIGTSDQIRNRLPEKSIQVHYSDSISAPGNINSFPVTTLEKNGIQIFIDKKIPDLRPIIKEACKLGPVKGINVIQPTITEAFRSMVKEKS